jgi:hypothetical protein
VKLFCKNKRRFEHPHCIFHYHHFHNVSHFKMVNREERSSQDHYYWKNDFKKVTMLFCSFDIVLHLWFQLHHWFKLMLRLEDKQRFEPSSYSPKQNGSFSKVFNDNLKKLIQSFKFLRKFEILKLQKFFLSWL